MTVHIVAHGVDLDGFGCHSILCRYFARLGDGKEIRNYFVDYQSIIETLPDLDFKEGDTLIMADIGYNPGMIDLFDNYSQFLSDDNFSWHDHHVWSEEEKNKVRELSGNLFVDETLCASEIVKDRYLHDDYVAGKLASFARSHDFYGKDSKRKTYEFACRLQDVISSSIIKSPLIDKMDIVKCFSKGIFWNQEFDEAYEGYQDVKKESIRYLDDTVTELDMVGPDNSRFSISLALADGNVDSKIIRKHMLARTDSDVVMAVWIDDEDGKSRVAFEMRDNENTDLRNMFFDAFNGRGRGSAGGGTFNGAVPDIDGDYKACFRQVVNTVSYQP